jgi:diacylglycerol kinase family enzyme
VAQIVGKYSKGRFREFPELITYVRGTFMDIECEREFVVNIDGEAVFAKKMSFKLIPKGINFIFPSDMKYFDSEITANA